MTVRRRKDVSTKKVIMHRVADIRGGVSIKTADLSGDMLPEGTLIGAPVDGICPVCKVARIQTGSIGTAINVDKGHPFKTGDFVMLAEGGAAYPIASIVSTAADKDVINVGTSVGSPAAGDYLLEAAAEATGGEGSKSALKVVPVAITGTSVPVTPNDNLIVDAWVIAVCNNGNIPSVFKSYVPTIVNINL